MRKLIIAGIGTEIGKTVVSSIVVEALQADYWKPVQSGALEDSDTETVRRLISNSVTRFHPETYRLREPLSPHAAAAIDGVEISLPAFQLPKTSNHLVVELAGGLLVPLNDRDLNIDLVQQLNLPVLLVSKHYLGSINHTLLSVEALQRRGIPILGLVFNGPATPTSEDFIVNYTGLRSFGRIEWKTGVTNDFVSQYATKMRALLEEIYAG
ncbi:dethiobiotin synthase [Larkinella terrae]|uniref:ATP-dependent dethiobiotin synthetase BioD n=1 Tax=Larkinella terrae TaxID=2025311 RepID=A0A7K0EVQ6_9BACT|nr:dethiobiotin synthase [Larkinella terrae]MRS65877.1 dethiobiotin synthase [Larkinella terrae]